MLSLSIIVLLTIHVLVSLLIVFIVLMQRPKSEGLGAAFGGGMTENLFGAQTTNVLANFTRWLGGIFFFLTLLLSILYAKQSTQHSAIQAAAIRAALAHPAPSASPASSAAPLSGTAALSGSGAFAAPVKLALPAASPGASMLEAPVTLGSPAPAAAAPSAGGSGSH